MRALALVLAAGQGIRLGREVPKGFVRLRGRSLLEWSAAALARTSEVAAVQCVLPAGAPVDWGAVRASVVGHAEFLEPGEGGARRQASVARGLDAAPPARPAPAGAWAPARAPSPAGAARPG